MKFRLRTLFAITALAGVWFSFARIDPWLPIVLAMMFAPTTVTFSYRCSRHFLTATTASIIALSLNPSVVTVPIAYCVVDYTSTTVGFGSIQNASYLLLNVVVVVYALALYWVASWMDGWKPVA